jgi:hypothetical protein
MSIVLRAWGAWPILTFYSMIVSELWILILQQPISNGGINMIAVGTTHKFPIELK